ncbi:MAG TPA: tripartite tricarboxylate transporter substrate binding protein [Hyphomicrobiaceae bacterium]
MGGTRYAAWFAAACAAVALLLPAGIAQGQQRYPSRAVQLVIPYPPGGSDALSRKLIVGMSEDLGQPIVVVNKPGASTQLATQMVVNASPDGYILYMSAPGELAAGPAMFKSLPFNALTDLTPISYVAEAPYTLLAASSLPVKTYAELVAFLKANPDKARFGSYGVQTQPDILARRFNQTIGVDVQVIPYQGGSPAFAAMVRGEVNLIFATLIPTRSFISAGQMVPLAIAADKRVKIFPDLPTLKELNVDIVDGASFGLAGPKGLPAEVVTRMHEAVVKELSNPETRKFVEEMGVVPIGSTPAEFGKRLADMTREWIEFAPKLGIEKQ